jgi:PAS domain S-box-containing protein
MVAERSRGRPGPSGISARVRAPYNGVVDFEALVRALGDAVIVADPEGRVRVWPPAAERIFGYAAAEAVGRSLDLIIPERFRARHWAGYQEVMRTGVTRYGATVLRVPAVRKGGDPVSIAFTVALLRDEDGRVSGIAAVVRDETERWAEEQALRRRLAALERGASSA